MKKVNAHGSRHGSFVVTRSSLNPDCELSFSGRCTLNQKIQSWDFDQGTYNIYKVLLSTWSSPHHLELPVYMEDNKIIETIVAPCLDGAGYSLTVGSSYSIRGQITRDDACGTAWEFNPLLVGHSRTTEEPLTPDGFQVTGCGRVKSVMKVMDSAGDHFQYHHVLINHQPTVLLILKTSSLKLSPSIQGLVGEFVEFCGFFIGEEIETGVLILTVE
ncbi:uncharacterized protein PGTG_20200 [Puccinia graminis f. sp. tritici CRL 75-36-700-3]|uniref:Uncharacterized protein n=1 Tax=Puccinia graminis f. sp. tritici (strain CRL 75-36-700-3 / race SCCL) TaxID=418459 RepID=E3NXG9_PUCGT|nr:uncharacterized protein PGTG_20200 [Puccinia graminis f. sp. tritici CRL 75-36-700-3]EFP94268.1 hypothetical protein PGTG_20200 [Puccinia graminis f. sp. tritici CRL 75-36-700-3]